MIQCLYSIFLILLLYPFSLNAEGLQNKACRSFWHPMYNGERLDYCTVDGKKCGKPVANRYCRLLGYAYATRSIIAHNLEYTQHLLSNVRCKGWNCNGFMLINCATHLGHTPSQTPHYHKRFVYPRWNNYRVDWCYSKRSACGARAAKAFCSHMGFMTAKKFINQTLVGLTQTIGSQELCLGPQCQGFREIICSR